MPASLSGPRPHHAITTCRPIMALSGSAWWPSSRPTAWASPPRRWRPRGPAGRRRRARPIQGSARRGQQVAPMPLAPAPRPGGRSRHRAPLVGESLVPGGGGLGDDGGGPVVVGDDGLGHVTALGAGQPAGVNEDPESLQRAPLPTVGYVLVVRQRRPVTRGCGDVPGRAAGPGGV